MLVNAFERGPLDVRCIEACAHLEWEGCAQVLFWNEDLSEERRCLQTLVSVRAMRHFANTWRRSARKKYSRRMRCNVHCIFYKIFPRDARCLLCAFLS